MTPNELDAVYTKFCREMSEAGEESAMLFLCRFAILTMIHEGDAQSLHRRIEQAGEGINFHAKPSNRRAGP